MNKERFQNFKRMRLVAVALTVVVVISGFKLMQENSVTIDKREIKNGVALYASNSNYYPVTIELEADLTNMTSSENNPLVTVLKGRSEEKIAELKVKDPKSSWGMKYSYIFYQGSIFAKHNDKMGYRLPFKIGEQHRLDQGYNGNFSHSGESRYSLDFNMKEGTEVYSSRAGIVVETEERYSKGGSDKSFLEKANYVTILHDDGTFAQYSHLRKNGVSVRIGQKIKAGERIGYSGATGYVTGPHLHFTVLKAKKGGGFISVPVKFATKDGIQELKEGEVYIGY
jgi:murein DD-endopeptidase MepM/ murein hydrolase activator NlpD